MRIRDANRQEVPALEALQRRSSDVWEQYREQLAAHPDAIEFPPHFIDNGWTRVAVVGYDVPVGFSVVIPGPRGTYELDGLFVEPDHMRRGVGSSLVEDACERARQAGAKRLEVTAGPAQVFYEKLGFGVVGSVETRFARAVRMHRHLETPGRHAETTAG
jgi:GNAT superfamily N-acetyltransferase